MCARPPNQAFEVFALYHIKQPLRESMKIVAVLFSAGELAKTPGFIANAENALGLREFLAGKGHELIVTADKDGPNSGKSV